MSQPGPASRDRLAVDIASLAVCSLIWGTTWFAIKLQIGDVPVLNSVVYRFTLASALLFGWCAFRRQALGLNRRQHLAALGQGAFGFCLQYGLVYLAEEKISSGAMAVIFASIPFINLVMFRITMRHRAPPLAWGATLLGLAGVGCMSVAEIRGAVGGDAGVLLALAAVAASVLANLYASKAQAAGVSVGLSTAWAMGYGAAILALFGLLTGSAWRFELTARYVGGMAYLVVFGSVTAFVVFYALARRRGYTFASYVAALTPPTAMLVSAVFEGTRWGPEAFVGLALVLAGQMLLIRSTRNSAL